MPLNLSPPEGAAGGACPPVAFSHDIFVAQRAGGITRCMLELMRGLSEMGAVWSAFSGSHDNEMLRAAQASDWGNSRIAAPDAAPTPIFPVARQERRFARWLENSPAKVLHRTYYAPVDLARALPRVETLHDMWSERRPSRGDMKATLRSIIKRRALQRADLVVCVSEHTRAEALATWPWLEQRTIVIPHGVRRLSAAPAPSNAPRPYFLFVGKRPLYKNFAVAARALAQANLPDHDLVCFGGGPFDASELALIQALGLAGRVRQLAGGDDRLAGLYESAEALLYPSRYEGFGLPVLEAMIHDCPVLCGDQTSLPEVAGDAGLLLSPDLPEAWSEAMQRIVHSADLRDVLRVAGRAQAARFSWERSARAHARAYASLA